MAIYENAIAWAQFRLLGGWKNLLSTSIVYGLVLALAMFGFARGVRGHPSTIFAAFMNLYLVLQVLALLVYGTMRVGSAVRADMNSRVIESHRLMPVSPANAVLGYLLGAPLQAYLLFAMNFLLGAVAVAGAGLPQQPWAIVNGVLLSFGVFVWIILAFFSFRGGLGIVLAIVAIFLTGMTGGMLLLFIPGINVLISPLIGHTIFDPRSGLGVDWPYQISIAAQIVIGLLFFLAACRRYRRDDLIGFSPLLGMLLLMAWVGVSIVGLLYGDEFRPFGRWGMFDEASETQLVQYLTSFALVLLTAVLPVASTTRMVEFAWPSRMMGGGSPVLRPLWRIAPLLSAVVASAITVLIVFAAPSVPRRQLAIARTGIACLAFLVSMRYLLGLAYRHTRMPRRIALGWIALTWAGPVIYELVRQSLIEDPTQPTPLSSISLCSPLTEVFQVWNHLEYFRTDRIIGLVVQCALAVLLGVLYHARRRRPAALPLPSPLPLPPPLPVNTGPV